MKVFKDKKEKPLGYCPQCDNPVLSSQDRKIDGEDWWHEKCYYNFRDKLEKANKTKTK